MRFQPLAWHRRSTCAPRFVTAQHSLVVRTAWCLLLPLLLRPAPLSSYDTAYANSKYFSSFDNAANADAVRSAGAAPCPPRAVVADPPVRRWHLCLRGAEQAQTAKFATSLARAVYAAAAGWNTTALAAQVPAGLEVDEAHVEALLQVRRVGGVGGVGVGHVTAT